MNFIQTLPYFIIFFSSLLLTLFWLLDSIITIVLSFTLFVFSFIIILLVVGVEFISISVAILYLGGIMILFAFISMTMGSEFLYKEPLNSINFRKKLINLSNNTINNMYKKQLTILSIIVILLVIKCSIFTMFILDAVVDILSILTAYFNEDENLIFKFIGVSDDINLFSYLLYTEFSAVVLLFSLLLYSVLIGISSIMNCKHLLK